MRDGLLRFISHVREPKSLASNFSVTGINHQMMLLPKFLCELEHVDILIVFHAGERFRAESFLGEEIEPRASHPIMHHRVRARVSSKTRLETLVENFSKLELQRVDVRDAGRAWRYPFSLIFLELKEIEIKSAIRNFFSARECFFRNGEQRKTRRQRERLLRAGQHHVDTERVHLD